MRFSFTPAPRAASMRLRMAASSASLAACNVSSFFCNELAHHTHSEGQPVPYLPAKLLCLA